MTQIKRNELRELMTLAWTFVRQLGMTMAEGMKAAWKQFKLKKELFKGIVKFYFKKVDGTVREAYGTLNADYLPTVEEKEDKKEKKHNPFLQAFFDTEKMEWRSYKIANLI